MASRGSTSFFIPTSGSSTQLEEIGYTPASGFQDLILRSLGIGTAAAGVAGALDITGSRAAAYLVNVTNNSATGYGVGVTAGDGYGVVAVNNSPGTTGAVALYGANNNASGGVAAYLKAYGYYGADPLTRTHVVVYDQTALTTAVCGPGIGFYMHNGDFDGGNIAAIKEDAVSSNWRTSMCFGTINTTSASPTAAQYKLRLTSAGYVQVQSGGLYGWSSTASVRPDTVVFDTGLSRSAAGVVAVGTGAQGSRAGGISANYLGLGIAADSTVGIYASNAWSAAIAVLSNGLSTTSLIQYQIGVSAATNPVHLIAGPPCTNAASGGATAYRAVLSVIDQSADAPGTLGTGAGIALSGYANTTWIQMAQVRAYHEVTSTTDLSSSLVFSTHPSVNNGNTMTDHWAITSLGKLQGRSGEVLGWTSSATDCTGATAADTGFSRTGAATVALGNGTASDVTGTLSLSKIKNANGTFAAPTYTFTSNTAFGISYNGTATINISGNVGQLYAADTTFATSRISMTLYDDSSAAAGVGGGFCLGGRATNGPVYTTFSGAYAYKDTAAGDGAASMIFWTQTSGSAAVAGLRITSAQHLQTASGSVIGWSSGTVTGSSSFDTGLSRISAGVIAVGNGTASDVTGTLRFATLQNATIDCSTASNTPILKLNYTYATPSNPTSTASATQVMCGLGSSVTLTPRSSGRVLIIVTSTTGGNASTQIRYGTGAAPANGAAATGTAVGKVRSNGNSGGQTSNAEHAIVSGLSVGTAYWFDLGQLNSGGGTTQVADVEYSVIEI